MLDKEIYEPERNTAWCPGCGNFPLRKALAQTLAELELGLDDFVIFSGIGQAAKMPHYFKSNAFNGLHGRALPPAIGFRMVNPEMKVIVESGDGDTYGEGGNHLLHNIRRNPDLAHFVHNNQIYGLTKGQASPTTGENIKTKVQPRGVTGEPFNPIRFAVAMKASFVARGFVNEKEQLVSLMKEALNHPGYALVDILQPCVTFNKVNTYQWYAERTYKLEDDYDPTDFSAAMEKADEWGEGIPLGVIYRQEKTIFRDKFANLAAELKTDYPEPKEQQDLLQEFV